MWACPSLPWSVFIYHHTCIIFLMLKKYFSILFSIKIGNLRQKTKCLRKKKGCFIVVQYANNWHGLLVSGTCLDLLGICLLPVVWRTLKIQEDSKGALRKLCYGGKHNRRALGSFKFQTSANLLFSLPQIINPTVNILNHRPVDLEGAKAALSNPLFRTQPCLPVLVNLPDVWPQHRCHRCISALLFWSNVQP